MFTKTITYTDFNGKSVTEDLHFHLSQSELMDMAYDLPDGVSDIVGNDPSNVTDEKASELVAKLGQKGIVDFVKKLLVKSYGIVSEDGRRFMKPETLAQEFEESIAFDTYFSELLSDENSAAEFINALVPNGVVTKKPATKKKSPTA